MLGQQILGCAALVSDTALVRAPLIGQSLGFTHDYQHSITSFRYQRADESGLPKSLTLRRNCVSIAFRK